MEFDVSRGCHELPGVDKELERCFSDLGSTSPDTGSFVTELRQIPQIPADLIMEKYGVPVVPPKELATLNLQLLEEMV